MISSCASQYSPSRLVLRAEGGGEGLLPARRSHRQRRAAPASTSASAPARVEAGIYMQCKQKIGTGHFPTSPHHRNIPLRPRDPRKHQPPEKFLGGEKKTPSILLERVYTAKVCMRRIAVSHASVPFDTREMKCGVAEPPWFISSIACDRETTARDDGKGIENHEARTDRFGKNSGENLPSERVTSKYGKIVEINRHMLYPGPLYVPLYSASRSDRFCLSMSSFCLSHLNIDMFDQRCSSPDLHCRGVGRELGWHSDHGRTLIGLFMERG